MTLKYLEAKKRHHYVWANYLARWGNGTKNVFYTTKTGKIACDSVRGIVVDDYFYRITPLTSKHIEVVRGWSGQSPSFLHHQHMSYLHDFMRIQHAELVYRKSGIRSPEVELRLHALKCNLLEDRHATHEKMAMSLLDALAAQKLNVLQDKQNMVNFMTFFGHQLSRTKTFRDGVCRVLSRRNAIEAEVADATAHAWWFLSYMFGMNIGYGLYIDRDKAKHALLINDTNLPFITSDQPIVNVHSCVSETEFYPPENADLYYPISPRVAYIICDSERYFSGKNDVDESVVWELNTKMAAQSLVHIIGDTENAIRPFQEYIGRRHRKALSGHPVV